MNPKQRDVRISQSSIVLAITGCLLIGFAPRVYPAIVGMIPSDSPCMQLILTLRTRPYTLYTQLRHEYCPSVCTICHGQEAPHYAHLHVLLRCQDVWCDDRYAPHGCTIHFHLEPGCVAPWSAVPFGSCKKNSDTL